MNDELQTVDQTNEIEGILSTRKLIQNLFKDVMKKDSDFGIIPGCEKPSLLKPGAEKICQLFHLAPSYQIARYDLGNNHREYEITACMKHIPSGEMVGEGVGSCSTMESKYRYRKAKHVCPICNQETIIKGKSEYGGGWLCWKKDGVSGGCGAKFADGDLSIESQVVGKIENPDLADQWNTMLKMAKKRALNDAVLTCTSASDIFTQDMEENQEATHETKTEPKQTQPPKADSQPKPANGNGNGDPNAFWGVINKRIPELMQSPTDKQIGEIRKTIADLASDCKQGVGHYVNEIGIDKAINNAIDRILPNQGEKTT